MNYVWVFELFCVFETAYMFLEPIVNYSFWYMENWIFSKPSKTTFDVVLWAGKEA